MMSDQLPEGWVWTTLGNLGNYINGRAFKPSDWGVTGKPIIRIQNLTGSTDTINRYSGNVEDKFLIRDGDLLISWSATLGVFIYRGEEAVLNQHIFKVEPRVNKMFLYYLVMAYLDTLKRQVHGSGMQHITKGKFDASPVPLPPLPEQERIVAKIEALFSQLDAGVVALRRIQAALKRYKASVLKAACEGRLVAQDPADEPAEALLRRLGKAPLVDDDLPALPEGWCWVRVGDIGADEKYAIVDGPFGSMLKVSDYVNDGDIPVISISNIDNGFEKEQVRYITHKKFETIKRSAVHPGDILVAKIGSSYGKVGYYPDWMPVGVIPANLLKISVHKVVNKSYIFYYLQSANFKKHLDGITKSTAQPAFNVSMFRELPLPFAPIPEQQRIVAEVERRLSVATEVEAVVAALLARSARLRQAILKQAFEGKLI